MPTPITTVERQLTYTCPNEMFSSSVSEGKTATINYTGPDRVWIMVDNDTGKISPPYYTSMEDGAEIPVPPGMTRVELSADNDEHLKIMGVMNRSLISEPVGAANLTETLPDGTTYVYTEPMPLPSVHLLDDITYNFDSSSWTIPYRSPQVTWDEVIQVRNNMLVASDGRIAPDMPDSVKQPWIEYRQLLRDLPTTLGKGTDNEVAPWKVQYPSRPAE